MSASNLDDIFRQDGIAQSAIKKDTVLTVYSDHTPIPFGKYKDRPLKDVPADYLLYLWDKDNGLWREKGDPLHEYIRNNMRALLMDAPDFDLKHNP